MSIKSESPSLIEIMHRHHSQRDYTGEAISEELLTKVIKAAHCGPTSVNGQQVSLIVTRDPLKKQKISEITGGQKHILSASVFITIIIDFYKTQIAITQTQSKQVIHTSVEGLLVGTLDAGIALGNLSTAAHALGLGAVAIGAIRKDPRALIDLLHLPPLTFPIVGLCLGHVAKDTPLKPRLPLETFCHLETYHQDNEQLKNTIALYDEQIAQYWQNIGRKDGLPWSQGIAKYYQQVYYPHVKDILKEQGFLLE